MLGFSSCFFLYCWLAVVDMLFWWTSNAWEKENDNGTNWCQVQCTWREEEKNPKEKSTVLLLLVPRVKPRCVKAERACATVFFFSEHCVRKEEERGGGMCPSLFTRQAAQLFYPSVTSWSICDGELSVCALFLCLSFLSSFSLLSSALGRW